MLLLVCTRSFRAPPALRGPLWGERSVLSPFERAERGPAVHGVPQARRSTLLAPSLQSLSRTKDAWPSCASDKTCCAPLPAQNGHAHAVKCLVAEGARPLIWLLNAHLGVRAHALATSTTGRVSRWRRGWAPAVRATALVHAAPGRLAHLEPAPTHVGFPFIPRAPSSLPPRLLRRALWPPVCPVACERRPQP